MAKYSVEINDVGNIKDILNIAYKHADEQLIQAQNEINKLSNATKLEQEPMDAKQKYAKAINDYLSIKDKAISKKMEIAKILSDIMLHNSNGKNGLIDDKNGSTKSFDFSKIKEMIDSSASDKEPKVNKITLTKK